MTKRKGDPVPATGREIYCSRNNGSRLGRSNVSVIMHGEQDEETRKIMRERLYTFHYSTVLA